MEITHFGVLCSALDQELQPPTDGTLIRNLGIDSLVKFRLYLYYLLLSSTTYLGLNMHYFFMLDLESNL
jgi:hypothetical protein